MSPILKTLRQSTGRTKKLFLAFLKSKRAIIGLAIIFGFAFVALAAPILTPYHPTLDTYLAGSGQRTARPLWFKTTGLDSSLSENVNPNPDTEFATADSLKIYKLETNASEYITFMRSAAIGTNGSLLLSYERAAASAPKIANLKVKSDFSFPFSGPPARYVITTRFLIEGSELVPMFPRIFLQDYDINKTTYFFGFGTGNDPTQVNNPLVGWVDKNFTGTSPRWITPDMPVTSDAEVRTRKYKFGLEVELAAVMIPYKGNYSFGLDLVFYDDPVRNVGKDARVLVYVDNLDIKLVGTSFGLLGTDWQGRDILTQLMYGARISLYVGVLAAVISVLLGLIIGLVSAYMGGIFDEAVMRLTDAILVLPGLPLLIVLIAVLGTSVSNLIIIIGFLGWMGFARVVRSQVLSLKERPFVEAARAIGAGKGHIIFKHIVPNVMSLVYVTLATSVPGAIVSEAALSFLGFYDPNAMSWGRMLNDVQTHSGYNSWWWVIPPGLCIAAISVSFILLGYALDEILNPRLRMRR